MIKLIEKKEKNDQAIHESLKKGFRTNHPERISGYAGFFFDMGDVFVTEQIYDRMKAGSEFREFIMESIKRFDKGDYGEVSEMDYDENQENRWLFGCPRIFGRYGFRYHTTYNGSKRYQDVIKIRFWYGSTYVLYESDLDTDAGLTWPQKKNADSPEAK